MRPRAPNENTSQPPFHDRVEGGVELGVGAYPEDRMFELGIPKTGSAAARQTRVHLAPNPAWLRVNEVTIGVSSSDVLFDLSGDEVSAGGQGTNRLARLAGHMLQQQSFYPLFPPPAGSAAQLDMRHAQRWGMPSTPDVLLVPSRLAQFAREVQVCVCVVSVVLGGWVGAGVWAWVMFSAFAFGFCLRVAAWCCWWWCRAMIGW